MLLTIKETAQALKVSISMVYKLVSSGEIPCYEIGSCKRIDETDLKAFLSTKRKEEVRLLKNSRRHF